MRVIQIEDLRPLLHGLLLTLADIKPGELRIVGC